MKCLNLGCGRRFNPAWTNVDCVADTPAVLNHDLRKGIPFPDQSFDVVYHSHLLEHLPRSSAEPFLRECFRVLKPGGIIRIAIPDLERIARTYLRALEAAVEGNQQWQENYDWMMLELFDQTVRDRTGGDLGSYLSQENIPNKDFVLDRIGFEARQAIEAAKQARTSREGKLLAQQTRPTILRRILALFRNPPARREALLRRVLGEEYESLQLGRFRNSGEIHMWMYDRYSLGKILQQAGFDNPQTVGPTESHVPDWTKNNLDTDPDGTVYKPDSLFMEAIRAAHTC